MIKKRGLVEMGNLKENLRLLKEEYEKRYLLSLQGKHYPKKIVDKIKESYKIIILTGVIFLFSVLILVGGIAYTTSPSFCKTCHVMKPYFDDWSTSTHAEIGCVTCHFKPGFWEMVVQRVATTKNIILYFVTGKGQIGTSKPLNEICLQCHIAEKRVSTAGDLIIPHPLHVKLQGVLCIKCHTNLVHHRPKGVKASLVPMETCYECHDGKKATNKCDACHTEKAYPASHKAADWFKVHGARSKTENCARCHAWRPDWCAQCHQKKPPSHVGRWRTNHKFKVSPDRKNCLACHQVAFCVRCHGIMP